MKYILADKKKALGAGFLEIAHRTNDGYMLLNETEVTYCDKLAGTLAERAALLGGEPLAKQDVWRKIHHTGKYQFKKI